jgi:hypothetical protein
MDQFSGPLAIGLKESPTIRVDGGAWNAFLL